MQDSKRRKIAESSWDARSAPRFYSPSTSHGIPNHVASFSRRPAHNGLHSSAPPCATINGSVQLSQNTAFRRDFITPYYVEHHESAPGGYYPPGQALIPLGSKENLPPSNLPSRSNSLDQNYNDVLCIAAGAQYETPSAAAHVVPPTHLEFSESHQTFGTYPSEHSSTNYDEFDEALIESLAKAEAEYNAKHQMDISSPVEPDILLAEDLEALAYCSDELERLQQEIGSHPIQHESNQTTSSSRPTSTGHGHSRKKLLGKAGSRDFLAQLHTQEQWFGLPHIVSQVYEMRGIKTLFSWQDEFLRNPSLNSGRNFLCSQPTSAGKTLVAEICLMKCCHLRQKKAIFILPYISIVQEKIKGLKQFGKFLHFQVEGYYGSNGSFPPPDGPTICVCTIEKANSLINHLIEADKLHDVGCLVVDEAHMIGSGDRGFLLEMMLTKIKYLHKSAIQVLGISATLPNLDDVGRWLDAGLYEGKERPIPLEEHFVIKDKVYNKDGVPIRTLSLPSSNNGGQQQRSQASSMNATAIALCLESICSGEANHPNSVLLFCPRKADCQTLAELLANELSTRQSQIRGSSRTTREHFVNSLTGRSNNAVLKHALLNGVGIHTSSLTADERLVVEQAFAQKAIHVICCTTTLAAGVNLPARRVVILSAKVGRDDLTSRDYRQMVGRAGRAGFDTMGESFLVLPTGSLEKGKKLLEPTMAAISSSLLRKCDVDAAGPKITLDERLAQKMITDLVGSGICVTSSDIIQFSHQTFAASLLPGGVAGLKSLAHKLESVLYSFLSFSPKLAELSSVDSARKSLERELSRDKTAEKTQLRRRAAYEAAAALKEPVWFLTDFGNSVFRGHFEQVEARVIKADLENAYRQINLASALQLYYLLIPPNQALYVMDWHALRKHIHRLDRQDRAQIEQLGIDVTWLEEREHMLANQTFPHMMTEKELPYRRLMSALLLREALPLETPFLQPLDAAEDDGTKRLQALKDEFKVGDAEFEAFSDKAALGAMSIVSTASRLGMPLLSEALKAVVPMLSGGVKTEIAPLCEIKGVRAHRAKQLYGAGYTTISSLAKADPRILAREVRLGPHPERAAELVIASARKLVEQKAQAVRKAAEEMLQREIGMSWSQLPANNKPANSHDFEAELEQDMYT